MRKIGLVPVTALWLAACVTPKKTVDTTVTHAASDTSPQTQSPYYDWFNENGLSDSIPGIGTDAAYRLLKEKKPREVIAAVIDDGLDINHVDLIGKIWTNTAEIPNNGKDDDHNGYIDDVHGWNFLGNAQGQIVDKDTDELTRLYRRYNAVFAGESEGEIPASKKYAFELYQRVKKEFDQKRAAAKVKQRELSLLAAVYQKADSTVRQALGKADYSIRDLEGDTTDNAVLQKSEMMLVQLKKNGFSPAALKAAQRHFEDELQYHYNPSYQAYESTVGTRNPHGNPIVFAPHPDHGTHVSGIIAANRHNGIGIKGIADNVKIMPIRAVPDGDERDENVAAAIRYAVDNGAKIINMSFGKRYSPQKGLVDAAVKAAMRHGVLIIHAAGNDAVDLDSVAYYPNADYADGGMAKNWITVGASGQGRDRALAAHFSNYSHDRVDVFAPGVNILSTVSNNRYEALSGTSMASPMVTGMAAVIWGYFPKLTASEVRDIILKSVNQPGSGKTQPQTVNFKRLCRTGGIANLCRAVQLAEKMSKR